MSLISNSSIHDILDKANWNYDELNLFLEEDASSINDRDQNRDAPLHRVLLNEKRSPDIIRLLVHHGADVNSQFSNGYYPLEILLYRNRNKDEAIIKVLLEGGADMNKLRRPGCSLLCIALSRHHVNVIRMLIEAGCPMNSCSIHESTIVCFIESLEFTHLNTDILKLLIEKCRGIDLNVVNQFGKSLLCFALSQFPGIDEFNFMLESGCSWNSCQCHGSPWLCVTSSSHPGQPPHLTKDLVQMLFDMELETNVVNNLNEHLLNCALKYCSYEMSAIQLMFDKEIVQLEGASSFGENALHAAVSNLCTTVRSNIVDFLVDRGADIHAVDNRGNTPLHLALRSYTPCNLNAIEALLKNGALINVTNANVETPLEMLIRFNRGGDVILLLLLNAGARMGADKWTFQSLTYALDKYVGLSNENYCCKLLIKYSLLNNPTIDISPLIPRHNYGDFVDECSDELQRMETISVSRHCTLYQIINKSSQMDLGDEDHEPLDLNRLINVLVHNKFPVYFDIISTIFCRKDMMPKLRKMFWYAKSDPETDKNKEIVLNLDSVCHIASYLSDEELLKLIIGSLNAE